jgi:phage shock protein E
LESVTAPDLRAPDTDSVEAVKPFYRVVATAVVTLGLAGLGTACSAGDTAQDSTATTVAVAAASLVGPAEFSQRVDDPRVVTINVHVPNEGNIAGTDLAIPFDQISGSAKLPEDRTTPLAVYCRSGNMSASAVKDLKAKGYTSIVELEGGYDAWIATGRTLQPAGTG